MPPKTDISLAWLHISPTTAEASQPNFPQGLALQFGSGIGSGLHQEMAATSCEQRLRYFQRFGGGEYVGFSGVCLDGFSDEGAKWGSERATFHWRTQASFHPAWLSLVRLNAQRKYKEDIPLGKWRSKEGRVGSQRGSGRMVEEAKPPPHKTNRPLFCDL